MLYRLYTEDKPNLTELAGNHFKGFTVTPAVGYWKGNQESSKVIEIVGNQSMKPEVKKLAREIKQVNNQESVLLQELPNDSEFI